MDGVVEHKHASDILRGRLSRAASFQIARFPHIGMIQKNHRRIFRRAPLSPCAARPAAATRSSVISGAAPALVAETITTANAGAPSATSAHSGT